MYLCIFCNINSLNLNESLLNEVVNSEWGQMKKIGVFRVTGLKI